MRLRRGRIRGVSQAAINQLLTLVAPKVGSLPRRPGVSLPPPASLSPDRPSANAEKLPPRRQAESPEGGMDMFRRLGAGARRLVVAYMMCLAGACVFVPWAQGGRGGPAALGYGFLWSPPEGYDPVVDLSRVTLEVVALTALFASILVAFLIGRDRSN
jgi:hypothetical protein